jgi:flagellar biosynthesis anti-sigma factor FlgM
MNVDRIQSELMRLYGGRSQNVRGGGSNPAPGSLTPGVDAGSTDVDSVALSDRASSLARLFGVAKEAPDVREGLVAQLRSQLRDGTYQPNDSAVAGRLLGLVDA